MIARYITLYVMLEYIMQRSIGDDAICGSVQGRTGMLSLVGVGVGPGTGGEEGRIAWLGTSSEASTGGEFRDRAGSGRVENFPSRHCTSRGSSVMMMIR